MEKFKIKTLHGAQLQPSIFAIRQLIFIDFFKLNLYMTPRNPLLYLVVGGTYVEAFPSLSASNSRSACR